jgi:hypothetical protein
MIYRIYVLDQAGYFTRPPHLVVCDDDKQATHFAHLYYLDGQPIEVWEEARRVVRLDPHKQ